MEPYAALCAAEAGFAATPRASFDDYQRELDRLKYPEDREFLAQQAEQEGEAASKPTSPDPNMIPVGEVAGIVEQEVIVREHRQRWAQAMQDPQFAEYAANASAADVGFDRQILTSIAAQANSPVVVAFLANRPEIAEELAAMPVARGVTEVTILRCDDARNLAAHTS